MDFLQLSILRAGGVPVAHSDYREAERRWVAPSPVQPARSRRSERSKALKRSVGSLLLAMGHGLAALGLALQHRTQESAANTSFDSCGATSAASH